MFCIKKNLELYCDLGLQISRIHRGIKFREEPWMKSYIELNTDLGTKGKMILKKIFLS